LENQAEERDNGCKEELARQKAAVLSHFEEKKDHFVFQRKLGVEGLVGAA